MHKITKALTTTAAAVALAGTFTIGPTAFASPGSPVGPTAAEAATVGWVKGTERTTTIRTGRVGIWDVYTTTTYQKFRTSVGTFEVVKSQTKSYRGRL